MPISAENGTLWVENSRICNEKKIFYKVSNDFNSPTIYFTYETNNAAKVFVSNALWHERKAAWAGSRRGWLSSAHLLQLLI